MAGQHSLHNARDRPLAPLACQNGRWQQLLDDGTYAMLLQIYTIE